MFHGFLILVKYFYLKRTEINIILDTLIDNGDGEENGGLSSGLEVQQNIKNQT